MPTKKPLTIGTPSLGKTYYPVEFQLQEVTKEQMLALIASMNAE